MKFFSLFTIILPMLSYGIMAAADNLAPNPGFEEIKGDQPIAWSAPQAKGFEWKVSTDDRHGGKAALRIALNHEVAKDAHIEVTSDQFSVTAGKLYRLLGWYKSTGWSGKGNIYSQTAVIFYDSAGRPMASRDGMLLQLPYAPTEAWRVAEMVTPAPEKAESARLMIRVHAYDAAQEKSPILYVDDFLMQSFEVPATPKDARRWGYPARTYGVNASAEKIPDSRVGGAWHARVGVNQAGTIISGPMVSEQGPGMYRVTYRMKIADNTSSDPVCTILLASNGLLNSHSLRSHQILATDFKQPNHFEDFSMDFLRPPWGGMQYLCTWCGKVDLWLDTFTVTEVRRLPDRELVSFYGESPTGEVKPDRAGGLFVLRGPFFPLYRLDELASALGTKVTRVAHMATPAFNSVLNPPFPIDAAELSGLRAVVLADVDAEALSFQGRNSLRRFAEAGGTVLVLGGWVSYGESKMEDTFLEEMLPVTSPGSFDHERCKKPLPLTPAADWVAGQGLPWKEAPSVLWMHRLTPKPGTKVLVTAGGKPFLVSGACGKGKVIACAGTVLGTAPAGTKVFWGWSGWPQLLAKCLSQ
ncbi:MAG: hypothetical protein KKD76_00720 [Verrucomicrobia bacterium]|nr:hypothetical protein [Verrucomicrobiota bacterium]